MEYKLVFKSGKEKMKSGNLLQILADATKTGVKWIIIDDVHLVIRTGSEIVVSAALVQRLTLSGADLELATGKRFFSSKKERDFFKIRI